MTFYKLSLLSYQYKEDVSVIVYEFGPWYRVLEHLTNLL